MIFSYLFISWLHHIEKGKKEWDVWMASLTQWTWVWANSRRWWREEKSGMLWSLGPRRVGYDLATEQQEQQGTGVDNSLSWFVLVYFICCLMLYLLGQWTTSLRGLCFFARAHCHSPQWRGHSRDFFFFSRQFRAGSLFMDVWRTR